MSSTITLVDYNYPVDDLWHDFLKKINLGFFSGYSIRKSKKKYSVYSDDFGLSNLLTSSNVSVFYFLVLNSKYLRFQVRKVVKHCGQ